LDGLGGDGGENGMALGKEGVEGSSEAVVVEEVSGDVPEVVGSGARGPVGDVDEGGGLAESRREEEAEDTAVREGELRVWG
jgi:hypothetical protein